MATCSPMRAQWCHLANTIELVHPSAHSSPQLKWQMDQFSRFCTAYGRKCLYFTMGTPIRVISLLSREMTELIPTVTMESRHSVDGPTGCDFSSIDIVRELWGPEVGSHSRFFQKLLFWKKNDPLWGNFQNFVPKGFTASQIHVLCANFVKFGRPKVGEIARCLPDQKKNKFQLSLSLSLLPKICQDQQQTMYSDCPKFHPNRFTSGGVIAERVNTIQTRHKVFAILGKATASLLSSYTLHLCKFKKNLLATFVLRR